MTKATVQWLQQQPCLGILKRWPISPVVERRQRRARRNPPRARAQVQDVRLWHHNARKTACPLGHPYDIVDRAGHRACRQCKRAHGRAAQQRRRARLKATA